MGPDVVGPMDKRINAGWEAAVLSPCGCVINCWVRSDRFLHRRETVKRKRYRVSESTKLSCVVGGCVSQSDNCIRLRTFLPLDDVKFHVIAFFQGFVAIQ